MAELGVGVPRGGRAVGLDPRLPSDTEEESQGRPAGPFSPTPSASASFVRSFVRSFPLLIGKAEHFSLSLSRSR